MYFNAETGRIICLTCIFFRKEFIIFEAYESEEIM